MTRALATALAGAALASGCGAPDALDRSDGAALAAARDRIDSALDTAEAMRTSPARARRLERRVRRIVESGAFESEPLDEFGYAALGELRLILPGLVLDDEQGDVKALDRRASTAFLAYASRDPGRALAPVAEREVAAIAKILEDTDAGGETELPVAGGDAADFAETLERDLRPVFPTAADRAGDLREDL